MTDQTNKTVSPLMVIIAFAIVYLVWGSTYFFIRMAIQHFPPFIMAALRFTTAGLLLLGWCFLRGERLVVVKDIKPAIVSGLLLLFTGNGTVAWAEQYLSSSLAAVLLASVPIWFVLLDKRNRKENFANKETVIGLVIGFFGVVLLFGENAVHSISSAGNKWQLISLGILVMGSISWAAGSLYAKYKSSGDSGSVNASWQMLAAGMAFISVSWTSGEWNKFHWQEISSSSWFALLYLILIGSLAGYSAYIWLLKVRRPTQVSTHAYVNPVVAVLLGVFLGAEKVSLIQVLGLAIILTSVLLLNKAKYRKEREGSVPSPAKVI
jgi:drug/metabolite transporter (DMT)-like permease